MCASSIVRKVNIEGRLAADNAQSKRGDEVVPSGGLGHEEARVQTDGDEECAENDKRDVESSLAAPRPVICLPELSPWRVV